MLVCPLTTLFTKDFTQEFPESPSTFSPHAALTWWSAAAPDLAPLLFSRIVSCSLCWGESHKATQQRCSNDTCKLLHPPQRREGLRDCAQDVIQPTCWNQKGGFVKEWLVPHQMGASGGKSNNCNSVCCHLQNYRILDHLYASSLIFWNSSDISQCERPENKNLEASPGWCGSVDWVLAGLQSQRSPLVWFWVRACAWVVQAGLCRGQLTDVSLTRPCFSPFLSPPLPLSLKINKIFKKKNLGKNDFP